MALTLKQRAYAGMWFAAAGMIPVLFVSPTALSAADPYDKGEAVIWLAIVPILIAGIIGSLLGASILDPHHVRKSWQAALRGLIVAVVAFLLFSILFSAWASYTNEYQSFVQMLFMMLMVGVIAVGWMVAFVGTFAGWLLYKIQEYRLAVAVKK